MQGDKVQLKQISCAITSMSKGYQGEGKFKCEDTGWTKAVNKEWYSQYMKSEQRKNNEFLKDPVGNKVASMTGWGVKKAGDSCKTKGKKKRHDGMNECMENKSRSGLSQLKQGKN